MAHKTMSKPERQDPFSMTALQSQLARIKKEEEEEVWISGEELYTEGSSDEELSATESRSRRKLNKTKKSPLPSVKRSVQQSRNQLLTNDAASKLSTTMTFSEDQQSNKQPIGLRDKVNSQNVSLTKSESRQEPPAPPPTPTQNVNSKEQVDQSICEQSSDEEDDEEPVGISWKAKRGTIVLPNCSNNIAEEADKC